jgi:amino acid transporter
MGLLAVLGTILVGQLMSILTSMSLSALVTNGKVQAGGIYFIVSRTLGPAFGGGIGMLYFLGYTTSVAFYAIALGSLAQSTYLPTCGAFCLLFFSLCWARQ